MRCTPSVCYDPRDREGSRYFRDESIIESTIKWLKSVRGYGEILGTRYASNIRIAVNINSHTETLIGRGIAWIALPAKICGIEQTITRRTKLRDKGILINTGRVGHHVKVRWRLWIYGQRSRWEANATARLHPGSSTIDAF